ncbi:hypothetical protein F5Y07DRAFT_398253 [Xylaria sp. FL0933]|nr:hypothetical protein F5Y07DRAFT_398253 [Xylaria sp. FL0933]
MKAFLATCRFGTTGTTTTTTRTLRRSLQTTRTSTMTMSTATTTTPTRLSRMQRWFPGTARPLIVSAPMAGITNPTLASEVVRAGGLGVYSHSLTPSSLIHIPRSRSLPPIPPPIPDPRLPPIFLSPAHVQPATF